MYLLETQAGNNTQDQQEVNYSIEELLSLDLDTITLLADQA